MTKLYVQADRLLIQRL